MPSYTAALTRRKVIESRQETGGLRLYRDVISKHRNRLAGATAATSDPGSVAIQVDGVTSDDGTAVTTTDVPVTTTEVDC